MITHVFSFVLLLTLVDKFVVQVSLGLRYDCLFFKFLFYEIHSFFSTYGYLSLVLCVRSLKSWLKFFGASQTEGKVRSPLWTLRKLKIKAISRLEILVQF